MEALLAAELLRAEWIAAEVLNMHTVKPIGPTPELREALGLSGSRIAARVRDPL